MAFVARTSSLALATFLLSVSHARAQGGPPYFTNDPGTPGNRRWEINIGYITIPETDQSTAHVPDLDINYGVGDRLQLTLEVAWLRHQLDSAPPRYGLSQDTLGAKWRFYGDDTGLAVSVFPQASINNPTSSVARGVVPPGASLTLPMEISKTFDGLAVNGEIGYTLVQSARAAWLAGIVAGHEKRIRHQKSTVEFDVEFYAAGDVGGETEQKTLEGGVRVGIRPPFVLLLMAGWSLAHTQESITAYAGLQLLLPARPFVSSR